MNSLFGAIGVFSTAMILFAIAIDLVNHRKSEKQDSSTKTPQSVTILSWLTATALYAFLLHSGIVSLIRLGVYPDADVFCLWLAKSVTALYHFTRGTLYAVLVCRVHVTFGGSVYEYNRRLVIAPLYALIASWLVSCVTLDMVFVGGHLGHEEVCVADHAWWGVVLSGSVDLLLSAICLALFVVPLAKLNKTGDMAMMELDAVSPSAVSSESDEPVPVPRLAAQSSRRTRHLGALILRYGLLVKIAILSTTLMHVALLWRGISDLAVPVDHAINAWCIILIKNVNKRLYRRLCYLCHGAMKLCWA